MTKFSMLVTGVGLILWLCVTGIQAAAPHLPGAGVMTYLTQSPDGFFRFHVLDPVTTEAFDLAGNLDFDLYLDTAPDGRRIVTQAVADGQSVLRVFDLYTGQAHDVPRNHPPFYRVYWGQNDTVLLSTINAEIHAVDINTGEPTLLHSDFADQMALSPNGRWLAYTQRDHLAIMDLQTAEETILIDAAAATETLPSAPVFSPDSTRLAYLSGSFDRERFGVYVVDLASQESRRASDRIFSGINYPVWSPDSQRLAFVALSGVQSDVYITNLKSDDWHQLTDTPGFEQQLVWSR